MKKLVLRIEELTVDSFATVRTPHRRRGTIIGNSYETVDITCGNTFSPQNTCYAGCDGDTVGLSCACVTSDCTANPRDFHCIDSMHYCYDTQQADCLE
jgi:hypothetical protein